MANVKAPDGFQYFRQLDGGSATQGQEAFKIKSDYSTPIGKGDLVIQHTTGYVQAYAAASTIACLGVFVGCRYLNVSKGYVDWSNSWPGSGNSGDVTAYINTDPQALFIGQSLLTAIAFANLGENIDVNVGVPSAENVGGLSTSTVSQALLNTTSTLPWRVYDLLSTYYGTSGNVNGTDDTSSYNRVILRPNNWARSQLTGLA